jgi:FixJ family two-component response regulator
MASGQPLVIVVEDDADMSRALESMLNAAGFDAAMYSSAEALLEAQVPADTACLVLDVHLPGMTGFDLYDKLTATHPPPPVIFITGYDEPAARARSLEAGAAAYLVKPFAGRRLIESINRAIRPRTPG